MVDSLGNPEVLADCGDDSVMVEGKGFQIRIGDFKHWGTFLGGTAVTEDAAADSTKLGGGIETEMGSKCAVGSMCALISMGNCDATLNREPSPEREVRDCLESNYEDWAKNLAGRKPKSWKSEVGSMKVCSEGPAADQQMAPTHTERVPKRGNPMRNQDIMSFRKALCLVL